MPRPLLAIPASGQFLSHSTFSGSETQLGHPLLQDALAYLPEGPSDFSEPPQPQATTWGLTGQDPNQVSQTQTLAVKCVGKKKEHGGGQGLPAPTSQELLGFWQLQQDLMIPVLPVGRMGVPIHQERAPNPIPQCQLRSQVTGEQQVLGQVLHSANPEHHELGGLVSVALHPGALWEDP